MIDIEVIEQKQELENIKDLCSELSAKYGLDDIYYSAEWFLKTITITRTGDNIVLLKILKDNEPIAFLPIFYRRECFGLNRIGFFKTPFFPPNSFHIIPDNVEYETVEHIVRFLDGYFKNWHVFSLEDIEKNTLFYSMLRKVLLRRTVFIDRPNYTSEKLILEGSYNDFINSKSRNFRRNLKRNESKLYKTGNVRVVKGDLKEGKYSESWGVVRDIDKRSWRMSKEKDIAKNNRLLDYCEMLMDIYRGQEERFLLYITLENKAIAAFFAIVKNGKMYAYKVNYDLEFSKYSPGIILLNTVIKECFVQNIKEINFLGRNEYIKRLSNKSISISKDICFNRSNIGLFLGYITSCGYKIKKYLKN